MKCNILVIFLLVIVPGLQACPDGWLFWSRSCYFQSNEAEDFASAFTFCEKFDSTLVNINSDTENDFIYNTLVLKPKYRSHFIGVMRQNCSSNTFVTSEEKPLKYTNWGKNEPDNENFAKNCGQMGKQGLWSDTRCDLKLPFICESDVTCDTEPCRNGGSCVDLPEENPAPYKCLCHGPFHGKNCEKKFKGCDTDWTAFGHHCYRAFPGPRPWSNARFICQRNNADLAAVESPEENTFLQKTFNKHNFWLGIKECLCGKRCTVNFSKLRYKNWGVCEPKEIEDEEEKGCTVFENDTGKWQNVNCKENRHTVCKREPRTTGSIKI